MQLRTRLTSIAAVLVIATASGCAVHRGQESVGEYIDDAAITTQVKAKFVDNKLVDAAAINVETLQGTVMLSGFAKNATEKSQAENIAESVKGVKNVKNEITVRP